MGKSIIIDAVSLLLGDRAVFSPSGLRSEPIVRRSKRLSPCPKTARSTKSLRSTLEAEGLEDPYHLVWLILGCEVRLNGRNIARVNGRSVSLQVLSELTAQLVDVHGQGKHSSLLQPKMHRSFCSIALATSCHSASPGPPSSPNCAGVQSELRLLRRDHGRWPNVWISCAFRSMRFTQPRWNSEDAELESERRRLSNAEALLTLAQAAETILGDGDGEMPQRLRSRQ